MVCANKTDLREDMAKQGRKVVHYEDGQRLAKEFGCLFIETSAKDGSNIMESVTELTRYKLFLDQVISIIITS